MPVARATEGLPQTWKTGTDPMPNFILQTERGILMKAQQKTEFTVEVYLGRELIPDKELGNLKLSSSLAHYCIPDGVTNEHENSDIR